MFAFIDTETTGLADDDGLVEVAICDQNGTPIFQSLVKPSKSEWPHAQAIHGISPDDVANAPKIEEIALIVKALCKGKTPVFYNAGFDTRFFPAGTFETEPVCVMMEWAAYKREVCPKRGGWRWHKLVAAAEEVGHQWTGQAHRAMADAQATASVWRFLRDTDVESVA